MNVYGALKAVRNRSAKSSKKEDGKKEGEDKGEGKGKGCQVKRESIKRKFYRWFPDLEQRFYRTEDGQYQPIYGHEQEVNYRKQMREKSFESVAQKRARANQRNNYLKKERGELPRGDQPLPELISSSGAVYIPPPPSKKVAFEAAIITSCLVSEDEEESSIIDNFFHASGSIFDEVNQEFYGEELPSSSIEIDSTNFNDENNALEGIVIGSGSSSSSSSSWEDDLELFGDGLLGILEDGSV